MKSKLELIIPSPLKELFQSCATYCVPACCGLDAFDVDASLIYRWFGGTPGPRSEEVLKQLDDLIAIVAAHDGPIDSTDELKFDFGHEWETSAKCVAYLQDWRTELVCAATFAMDVLELPDARLEDARLRGEKEFQESVHRIVSDARILLYKGNTKVALRILSPVVALNDHDEAIGRHVRTARELLEDAGQTRDDPKR